MTKMDGMDSVIVQLQLHYLEYWILHSCFSIFLKFLDLFWWIPFYDHSMFLFWSYLSFDTTIKEYYNVFETDLISLGILPSSPTSSGSNQKKVELHQTKTVQAFKAIAKRMPTADEEALEEALQGFGNDDGGDDDYNNNNSHQDQGIILSKDQERAIVQLKSLIKQLPTKDIDDDDKTTQLLEMLINQLSREEEKVVQEIERAFQQEQEEDVVEEVVRVLIEGEGEEEVTTDDEDVYDTWMEDVADYDHKGEINKNNNITGNYMLVESATSSDDEDCFFETTTGSSNTTGTYKSSKELQEALAKVRERGGGGNESLRFPDAHVEHVAVRNGRPSVATTTTLRNRKKPKSEFTSLVMDIDSTNTVKNNRQKPITEQQRRLKTERETISSTGTTTSSFVTRLMTRMEQNQKNKRKEKREKLKEKRREKIGKQETQ